MEYAQSEASMPLAIGLFTKAADAKHLLAYWYLAHMNEQGMTPRPSCRVAVSVSIFLLCVRLGLLFISSVVLQGNC